MGLVEAPEEPSLIPLKTVGPVAAGPVAVEGWVELNVVVAFLGLCAPQGLSSRHLLEQVLSLPQPFTHWVPHCWQV